MKLNIDLSNTELRAALDNFTNSAKREAELEVVLRDTQSKGYALQREVAELKSKVQSAEASRDCARDDANYYRNEIDRGAEAWRDQLRKAEAGGIPIVPCTEEEMRMALQLLVTFLNNPAVKPGLPLIRHILKSEKIAAIKAVREATQCGLREAKDLVEATVFP